MGPLAEHWQSIEETGEKEGAATQVQRKTHDIHQPFFIFTYVLNCYRLCKYLPQGSHMIGRTMSWFKVGHITLKRGWSMEKKKSKVLENGIKLAGEAVLVPGCSLLMEGKVKPGLLHIIGGFAAKAVLGPPAAVLVAANSFCTSMTGKNLVSTILEPADPRQVNLVDLVNGGIENGHTMEEIREELVEDIEDLYTEAITKKEPPSG